jgi:hypothetical protein
MQLLLLLLLLLQHQVQDAPMQNIGKQCIVYSMIKLEQ